MSTASAVHHSHSAPHAGHGPAHRPNLVSVGTMVWLSSELMFFAGLFAIYFTIRGVVPEQWVWGPEKLNVPFASVNTAILVISSVFCQAGVMAAERGQPGRTGSFFNLKGWGMREWYTLTYIFGAIFVSGQVWEYANLVGDGMQIFTNGYSSSFFMATGFHALHVTGGLIVFLLIIARSFTAKRYTHANVTGAIVLSYYWHFVDVVWIALFFVIYLVK